MQFLALGNLWKRNVRRGISERVKQVFKNINTFFGTSETFLSKTVELLRRLLFTFIAFKNYNKNEKKRR